MRLGSSAQNRYFLAQSKLERVWQAFFERNSFGALDLRMRRIFKDDGRTLIVPIDHATTAGPIGGLARPKSIIEAAVAAQADAVMLRPGLMNALDVSGAEKLGIIMALTGRLTQGVDHILLNSVEQAVASGADAICGEFKFGSEGDLENADIISKLAEEAHRLELPVLVTVYARPNIVDELGSAAYAHGCRIAEEIGADFVKTSLPDDAAIIAECVDAVSIPIVVAGGAQRSDDELDNYLRGALSDGISGAAIGRNAWMSDKPEVCMRRLVSTIHNSGAPE